MALHFHKTPIVLSAITLKNLIARYGEYTKAIDFPTIDEESYERCKYTIALLQSSIIQIREARENLQRLYSLVRDEYSGCKNKTERKELLQEIEQIEAESKVHIITAESEELTFMLSARLDEVRCVQDKMDVRLGYTTQRAQRIDVLNTENATNVGQDNVSEPNSLENAGELGVASTSADTPDYSRPPNQTRIRSCRSIKPPQASLPKFYGDAEEFAEYWAIFQTLVHESPELDTMEKILLLKESLKGKAQNSIKGIRLVPENYQWIIETLRSNYCDDAVSRPRIVKKLVNMKPASNTAESCAMVFDQIQVLTNQMISSGYDVRNTSDPMWCEAILGKFPRDIIRPVLMSCRTNANQGTGTIMSLIKEEIAAKRYLESRIGHTMSDKVTTIRDMPCQQRSEGNNDCIFCRRSNHSSLACRTVTDQNSRRKTLKDGNRCWKCFSSDHSSFDCHRPDCSQCGQKHHSSLCYKKDSNSTRLNKPWQNSQRNGPSKPNRVQNRDNRNPNGFKERGNVANNSAHMENRNLQPVVSEHMQTAAQLVLMTAEGNLWDYTSKEYKKVLFFFDSGAQKTVIEEELAFQFGLPKQSTEICTMSGIGGHVENFSSHIVLAKVGTAYGDEIEMKIQTKPVITNGFPSMNVSKVDITFLKENGIYLANSKLRGQHQIPNILVGLDYYHELVSGPGHGLRTPSGFHIAKTVFGPTLYGKSYATENSSSRVSYGMTTILEMSNDEMVRRMFELEGLGISEKESQTDDRVAEYLDQYSKTILFKDGHITAPFPLKPNVHQLTDNYAVAICRLESLQKTLRQNSDQCKWYFDIFRKYEREGIIETFTETCPEAVATYYMPHSGIWKPNKEVPLRIVFDASSKKKGNLSLNDVIHKGQSFVNKIHDIILKSRSNNIILLCDIEAAFTQIRLVDKHKDLCRMLWVKNINLPPTKDNLIQYRFKRLPFGITACPSILNMTLMSYLGKVNSPLAEEIANNLYVDNIMMLAHTVQEAITKYHQSKELFSRIGMNLRQYVSNSEEVNLYIPKVDRLNSSTIKILGVEFDIRQDIFKVSTTLPQVESLTKREIVSMINSVYDPIGLAGPLLVNLKSLMREQFDGKVDWKTPLDIRVRIEWNRLCERVNNATISVPRPILSRSEQVTSVLWVFADASIAAIAACAYMQCTGTGEVSSLISGKTRLAPKKSRQTIPRLEMVGLLMASRLASNIIENYHHVKEVFMVTDSEIALCWLKSNKKLPPFVKNQCNKIQDIKKSMESKGVQMSFFHVRTDYNPADAGTRGLKNTEINEHDWVRGPQWLKNDPKSWPLRKIESVKEIEVDHVDEVTLLPITTLDAGKNTRGAVIDLSRFSNLDKVLRVMALTGKVLKKWTLSTNKNRNTAIRLVQLLEFDDGEETTSNDIELAEKTILLQEQRNLILEHLLKRYREKKIIRDDKGIIRNESRLQNAEIPYDARSPIYIPEKSELIRLIVLQIHKKNAHCGKDHTLAIARQRFWIPRASNAFKMYLKNCPTCKKYQGLPLGAPSMPPLPPDRVIRSKPFENVGSDFMGPFISKTQEKMYVALYTCLTTRALHLELVENMSTSAFLRSFIRFISRRGVPRIMRTDCGSNFKQGERILNTMFEKDVTNGSSLMSYCASEKIKWIFNPPASPWMGGAWERLVGSVKKAFNKSVGRRRLDFMEMSTTLTQIEAILNTRPLTKHNSAELDIIPLRPIDFLQGNIKFSLPITSEHADYDDPTYDPEFIQSEKQALEAVKHSEKIAGKFWDNWKSLYLISLRETQKALLKQPRHLNRIFPEIGEIVIIEQDLVPRGNWPYGRIAELIKSTDGWVRSAKILMGNHKIIQRPLNRIFPLEIRSIPENVPIKESISNDRIIPPNDVDSRQINERAKKDWATRNNDVECSNTCNKRGRKTAIGSKQLPQRASKTRAYKIIRDFEASLETQQISVTHSRVKPLILMTLLTLIAPALSKSTAENILCGNGIVKVIPPSIIFELCFDTECRVLKKVSRQQAYYLPISPTNTSVKVSLDYKDSTGQTKQVVFCNRPPFCDHHGIMSKTLLGNPHCWPEGAILTTMILACLAVIMILAASYTAKKAVSHCVARVTRQRSTNSGTRTESCLFELTPLPAVKTLAAIAVLCMMVHTGNACQHGFTRQTADLVCDDHHEKCFYEYNREILFNRLVSEVCIELVHKEKMIGFVKISMQPVHYKCVKTTEFFTRPTKVRVYHATRCAQAGSCTMDRCLKMHANKTIPELKEASKYPGYSGCISGCGGILCGCLLPLPACYFYRVALIPTSKRAFEIARCDHWTPLITVKVEHTIGKTTKQSILLKPYVTEKIENINFTVISLQKPTNSLSTRKFAISENKAILLPADFKAPVECESASIAKNKFATCSNRIRCECGTSSLQCQCPQASLRTLYGNNDYMLPLETPHERLFLLEHDIITASNEGEVILRIESNMMKNSTEMISKKECEINVSSASGCYKCSHGAQFTVNCTAAITETITVVCSSHQFDIICDPVGGRNSLLLDFDQAMVKEDCTAYCTDKPRSFVLTGRLLYHIERPEISVFENDVHGIHLEHQWLSDFSMPDISPLMAVIKQHWKLAMAAATTTLLFIAATYILGPSVVLVIVKLLMNTLTITVRLGIYLLRSCVSSIRLLTSSKAPQTIEME